MEDIQLREAQEVRLDLRGESKAKQIPHDVHIGPQKIQLYLLGYELLRHLSSRVSVDAEQDEYYTNFLRPIFETFEDQYHWNCPAFAKVIFKIIVNNDSKSEIQYESADPNKDWLKMFKERANIASFTL